MTEIPAPPRRREPVVLLAAGAVALVLSGIRPHAYGTWLLEVPAGEWVAMCGAVLSQVVFARTHDRQLRGLHRSPSGR